MRKLIAALFCMMLGGGFVYMAFQYHLVRADDEYALVPKLSSSLTDTYVDVRSWDASEWRRHPALVRALVRQGRSDLVVAPTARGLLDDLLRPFRSAEHEPSAPRKR